VRVDQCKSENWRSPNLKILEDAVANDLKNAGQALSEDYEAMARMLAVVLMGLVRAGGEEWTAPFEVFMAGADDDAVAHSKRDEISRTAPLH
jgi:hypothetical protein